MELKRNFKQNGSFQCHSLFVARAYSGLLYEDETVYISHVIIAKTKGVLCFIDEVLIIYVQKVWNQKIITTFKNEIPLHIQVIAE